MLGSFARRTGFWLLDAVKGGEVRTRKAQLKRIKAARQGNDQALTALLQHAMETVPAYSEVKTPRLEEFPVVSKKEYRENFEAFCSTAFPNPEVLHKVYTSGSTGTPFMAYQDREKLLWHRAGLMLLNDQIGWRLGDRFMFMRLWGVGHSAGRLSQWMSNTVPVDVRGLNKEKLEQIRQRILRDRSLQLILGYASAVESLAKHVIEAGDSPKDLGIRLIIADSEHLSDAAKITIEESFDCPVMDRYGNNENGILGMSFGEERAMEVNFPEYYMEILRLDRDEPAPAGELGRIVITDLYNKAFPFIRYDTGDVGVAAEMYQNQCLKLASLGGRAATVLHDTTGHPLSETSIVAFFKDIAEVGRLQLAQVAEGAYELRLENTPETLDELLEERCKTCFGADAQVSVRHVDHIPQEKNGKYKTIVREMT